MATAFVKVAAAPHWNVTTVNNYRTDRGLEYVLVDEATLPLLHAYLASARFGVSIDFSITLSIRIVNSGTPTPSAHV